ncbi:TIGR04211 family SH3 domain-containing protein [Thalassotalea agarivorans]|uniref:SH3 domain protein n=1 Tax=Thalassotalea agarivorans TaxID=349064 RepID=A0A1I0HT19_THASX|nr:TIGR04211 family SH3 domain-containing protein [Thalassotalea agarivorans]SET87322.1 SH3 domain protein [Thalassotalea agarivorans]
MKNVKQIIIAWTLVLSALFSFGANAQQGYVIDDLFIYMHSGAGNQYRIVGTVNAGADVKLTGQVANGYTQIITDKNVTAWVESKFVTRTAGIRVAYAHLNNQLKESNSGINALSSKLESARDQVITLKSENTDLTNQIAQLTTELAQVKSDMKSQDSSLINHWMMRGAMILGVGLILGLVLPRLGGSKKRHSQSWK